MEQLICTNRKIRVNKYSHEPYLENCGHCFPCQLRKRNHYLHQLFSELTKCYKHAYFVTLTFDDAHIIYVDSILHKNVSSHSYPYSYSLYFSQKDIEKLYYNFDMEFVNNLIRDYQDEYNFKYHLSENDFNHLFGESSHSLHIDTLYNNSNIQFDECNNYHFRTAYYPFKAGQLFIKRLRKSFNNFCKGQNLLDTKKIVYFMVQEYGPTTLRPHFHLLIISNSDYLPNYFNKTCKKYGSRTNIYTHPCWKYGFVDFQRVLSEQKVSTYIAGYINSFQLLPSTHVQQNLFKTKHSHSVGLGFDSNFYDESIQFINSHFTSFVSKNTDLYNLLQSNYEDNFIAKNICSNKSDVQQKQIAISPRLFPKLPFQFLASAKYSYSIFEEIMRITPQEFKDIRFNHNSYNSLIQNLSFRCPVIASRLIQYLNFMISSYENNVYKIFKTRSFNTWYVKLTGEERFIFDNSLIHSSFYHELFKSYLVYNYIGAMYSRINQFHHTFSQFPNLYKKWSNWIEICFNIYVFFNDLRDKYLLNRFYPTLINYMGENNYEFEDIAPIFYPTDYEDNQLTQQISKYLTSLMPEYTKHRASFEPKFK